MKAIFVCTHGEAAKELIRTAEMICGHQENVESTYFKVGETKEDLKMRIKNTLNSLCLEEGVLFLTDLKGGTPFNVLVEIVVELKQAELLSGVNIPMLLEAFISREHSSLPALTIQAAKTASCGIYHYKNDINEIEEDF